MIFNTSARFEIVFINSPGYKPLISSLIDTIPEDRSSLSAGSYGQACSYDV
jgi:hypothetical protein